MIRSIRATALVCVFSGCRAGPASAVGNAVDAAVEGAADAARDARAAATIDAEAPDDTALPSNTDELQTRARHLVEAIAQSDATLAVDILFPRDAWLATRDAADPGKDWEMHVAEPFRRSVRAIARHHRDLEHAEAISLQLGSSMSEANPRKHGWKKPLWIVNGSTLTFVAGGHTRTLSIREMVAWRGAWYVTRLR